MSIVAGLYLLVCRVEPLQSTVGLRILNTSCGPGPLDYGRAFVLQQGLPDSVAVSFVERGQVFGQLTPAAPSMRDCASSLLIWLHIVETQNPMVNAYTNPITP